MGAGSSSAATLPFPSHWLAENDSVEEACAAVCALSAMPIEHFLQVGAKGTIFLESLPELEAKKWFATWNDETSCAFKEHAAAAMSHDHNLNRLAYRCVPRRASEAEFWRCYYIWTWQLLIQRRGLRSRPPASANELQVAQETEEQIGSEEATVARYDQEVLEPLRAEVAERHAEYEQYLADSTTNPGNAPTRSHVRTARAYRKAIEAAEADLEDAREGLRELMASMRKKHRRGRAWNQ